MRKAPLIAALILAAGCSHQPVSAPSATAKSGPAAVPAEQTIDHEGDSMGTAVIVPGDAPNDGLDFAMEWTFKRYGRFRKKSGALGNSEGRKYEVLTVEFPDGSERVLYFDITEAWNNWKPAKK